MNLNKSLRLILKSSALIFLSLSFTQSNASTPEGSSKPNCTAPYYICRSNHNPGCGKCRSYVELGCDKIRPMYKEGKKLTESIKNKLRDIEQCRIDIANEEKVEKATSGLSGIEKSCKEAKLKCKQTSKGTKGCGACFDYVELGCDYTDPILPDSRGAAYNKILDTRGYLLENINSCHKELSIKKKGADKCDLDREIVQLENLGDKTFKLGSALRILLEKDIPKYPYQEFNVLIKNDVFQLEIIDREELAQKIVDMSDATNYILSLFTDISPIFNVEKISGINRSNLGFKAIKSIFDQPALVLTLWNGLRDQILKQKRTGDGQEMVINFLESVVTSVKMTRFLKEKIICTVDHGVPVYLNNFNSLIQQRDSLREKIKENPGCPATYDDLLDLKAKTNENLALYQWHLKGAHVSPVGFTRRGNWYDSQLQNGHSVVIMNTDCSKWEKRVK